MFLILARPRRLVLVLAALVAAAQTPAVSSGSSSSNSLGVDVSLVVHVDAAFSAVLTLPPSLAKKTNVEAEASVVHADGRQNRLVKQKLSVSAGGEVLMQHELGGLRVG